MLSKHNTTCNASNCHLLSRNNRDQEVCRDNNNERVNLYFGHNDPIKLIFSNYWIKYVLFLHSFDRAFRFTTNWYKFKMN